jgi:hypothetical protein
MPPTDTRALFRPVSSALVTLLRGLQPAEWQGPTVAGTWVVRDVVAHLVDVSFRRLSFHRDAMTPPSPAGPIGSRRDFVEFINSINAQWVEAARRFSPRVLTDLFEKGSAELADWTLHAGEPPAPTTRVALSDDVTWKLLFNALPETQAAAAIRVEGSPALAEPLLRARSVIV